jgi:hypothetical protein
MSMPMSTTAGKLLGVTVLPEYAQSEGVDGVLDRLVGTAGVNAVTISPYVMEEADEQDGCREPPDDAGAGGVRLLDRPLWGKRELFVRTAPSFEPDRALYEGLRYQPPSPNELTLREGEVVDEFIRAAKLRQLRVYLQVQSAIPPGYRVQFGGPLEDDCPRLPDGTVPPRRLANNGSLASPHIVAYAHAMTRDLVTRYPDIDGIRFDWPEYPPYLLDSVFLDFGDHARRAAERLGFDFEPMRRDVGELYRKLHGGLTDVDLQDWTASEDGHGLLRLRDLYPGVVEWIRFKASLVDELLSGFRAVLDAASDKSLEMLPNAFAPPWNVASGMDFARAGKHSDGISVKLYTMHWPMMLRFYGDQIAGANPGLSRDLLVRALVEWLELADDGGLPTLEDYSYPPPDVAHPAGANAQARKIRAAQRDAGETPIYSLCHAYGPRDDFAERLRVAWQASEHGVWVNRYGYLSNEKLDAIGELRAP